MKNEKRIPSAHAGLKTGFDGVDGFLHGIYPGEVLLLGGRPGMGKSAFAKGVARAVCHDRKVLYLDMQHGKHESQRILIVQTGGFLELNDIRRAIGQELPALVILDPFQRVLCATLHNAAAVLREIKKMALEFGISFLITTKLLRTPEKRSDPIPTTGDIPNCQELLPFVDTVLLLFRPAYYDPDADRRSAICIAEKTACAECKIIPLRWDDAYAAFADYAM